MNYDPDVAPDSVEWLALSEAERIEVIEEHHRESGIPAGNMTAHAGIDAAVETQLAEGLPEVRHALDRLVNGGVPRPEALHAIGAVLAEEIFKVLKHGKSFDIGVYAKRLKSISPSTLEAKE